MNRPNIILITTHDLGRHLSCYGASTVLSPHLNQLAERGIRFAQSFATAPQCSPARAALTTGRFPHTNGVMGLSHDAFAWLLPVTERPLSALLRDHGYRTALHGLQHVTTSPARLGFEECAPVAPAETMAAVTADWLGHQVGQDRPFYLEIGFDDTHRRWNTHNPERSLGTARPRWLPPYPGDAEEMAALQGEITAVDRGVGQVLDALDDTGLMDSTWVIFTSDHGLPLPRAKGTLYDPGIEVPLIMWIPKLPVVSGTVFREFISHIDLVPTILEALGITWPPGLQGISFWPLLHSKPYAARTAIFAEKTYHNDYDPVRAIRTDQYKLIMHFSTADVANVPTDVKDSPAYEILRPELTRLAPYCELFDLHKDPLEQENLAFTPSWQDARNALLTRLYRWMQRTGDPLLEHPIAAPAYHTALALLRNA